MMRGGGREFWRDFEPVLGGTLCHNNHVSDWMLTAFFMIISNACLDLECHVADRDCVYVTVDIRSQAYAFPKALRTSRAGNYLLVF